MSNPTLIRELLADHAASKKKLERYKVREMKLRLKITSLLFPDAHKGTNKASLKELGLDVKAVIKETASVKQEGLEDLIGDNEELARAFKTKYDFVNAGYNSLSDEEKKLLGNAVIFKLGTPELSYEGELPNGIINSLSTSEGLLLINGEFQGVMIADQTAKYLGFQYAEQLVKFLEEIQ